MVAVIGKYQGIYKPKVFSLFLNELMFCFEDSVTTSALIFLDIVVGGIGIVPLSMSNP